LAVTALAAAVLAACGGGDSAAPFDDPGSSSLLSETGSSVANGDLMISEVASNYYSDDVAWLEIHNPTASSISLKDYLLRGSYLDLDTQYASYNPVSFALPDVVVPAGGYMVVAGRVLDTLEDNEQMVYVRSGSIVPFWSGHGSLELLRAGQTVDFVRFGNSNAVPATRAAWRGSAVAALPAGPNEHGKAIVRLQKSGMPDSNTAADWAQVNFATPAGPNDIGPGVIDSDADGIPDSAKQAGGTYGGLDLYAMGARPGRRDIFIEIDYMKGNDPALLPRQEALQKVVDAFAQHDIALHFDTGAIYAEQFEPAHFNLGGGNAVAFEPCIELVTSGAAPRAGCTSFYDYKRDHFDVRRNLVFHYALFANSLNSDGSSGSSGVAELNGNDLIVSLGGYGFSTAPGRNLNMLINLQASTLMHELGHNLGLRHGGNEEQNYKPNHYSVMNYMYQFAGLSETPDSINAAERYYLAAGVKNKTLCNLVENSPCGEAFRIDYSDGRGAPLDERNLYEGANIGRGAVSGAYADWDNSGGLTGSPLARNLNPQFDGRLSVLRDFDEWSNLSIPFARSRNGNNYGDTLDVGEPEAAVRPNPMNLRSIQRIDEAPLPMALQQALDEAHGALHAWKQHHE